MKTPDKVRGKEDEQNYQNGPWISYITEVLMEAQIKQKCPQTPGMLLGFPPVPWTHCLFPPPPFPVEYNCTAPLCMHPAVHRTTDDVQN